MRNVYSFQYKNRNDNTNNKIVFIIVYLCDLKEQKIKQEKKKRNNKKF